MIKKYGDYYVTIGLEIHVALNTDTKLFSSTENKFEVSDFSLFDIGLPGILPVLSEGSVEKACAFAMAIKANIQQYSEFERKHYFYPDLPLGYQITQQNKPIMIGGIVPIEINGIVKMVEIEHAHLECDAAKSLHDLYSEYTAIDISRCASPLLEIVSMPCMHSPEEAKEYAKNVHSLVLFLGICDGKLEEGSFRVDASISLCKEIGKLGTRVEIKNISSFNFLQQALEYEISRQSDILNRNDIIKMETRLFDEQSCSTKSMRDKETVDEYRYLPDPDIAPLIIDNSFIQGIAENYIINYYELKSWLIDQCIKHKIEIDETRMNTILFSYKNVFKEIYQNKTISSERLLRLICFWIPDVASQKISGRQLSLNDLLVLEKSNLQAKEIKQAVIDWTIGNQPIDTYIPVLMTGSLLSETILGLLKEYPDQFETAKKGDVKLIQFLTGKVMAVLKGKAAASDVKQQIEKIVQVHK